MLGAVAAFSYGQAAKYGQLTAGKFDTYQAQNGAVISVNDTLIIGTPTGNNAFNYINQGVQPVAPHLSGVPVVVSKLKTDGNKRRGFIMYAYFKGWGIPCAINIEPAIKHGEIELKQKGGV